MDSAPYFTVIIPTYNRSNLLAEALDSVLGQTFTDFEVVVVDDASPSPVVVPGDVRVRLLRNESNKGKSASVNRALAHARGRVVAFLDDDDAWTPTRLASARDAHQGGADVVFCGTGGLVQEGAEFQESEPPHRVKPVFHHMGATSVVVEKCPFFDESFAAAEDLEWAVRLAEQRPVVATVNMADFLWRRHQGERHGNGIRERIKGNLMLLEKHHGYFDQRPIEKAQRFHRIGLFKYMLGERSAALNYATRSLLTRPNSEAIELMVRVFLPSTWSIALVRESLSVRKASSGRSSTR